MLLGRIHSIWRIPSAVPSERSTEASVRPCKITSRERARERVALVLYLRAEGKLARSNLAFRHIQLRLESRDGENRNIEMAEHVWYIKNCRLFERLTPEQIARLEQRARVRRFPKGTPIYLPSDSGGGVFLLAEGRVKLCSTTPDGKQAILAFIEPGELFGELALLEESEREEHAETMVASTLVLLPGDAIEQLMSESADLALSVTKLIGLRRKRIERRLKSLLFRSNRDRLIHLLLDLAGQYGRDSEEGILLSIPLSHQDLASVIGATRETVTTLLGELQLERLLKVARQRLVIRDLKRLAGCVEASPPVLPSGSAKPAGFAKPARPPLGTEPR